MLVAQELGLPFIYVRAKPKEHGTGNLIEGDIVTGKTCCCAGRPYIYREKQPSRPSKQLRGAGYDVAGLAAIFSYGFDVATQSFKQANCPFVTLSNYNALIKYAGSNQYISDSDVEILKQWRENPAEWGR